MKKIKVKIVDELTLALEEKGEIGDLIDLNDVLTVDCTFLNQAIEQKRDSLYLEKLEAVKKNEQAALSLALAKLEKEKEEIINQLKLANIANLNQLKEQLALSSNEQLKEKEKTLDQLKDQHAQQLNAQAAKLNEELNNKQVEIHKLQVDLQALNDASAKNEERIKQIQDAHLLRIKEIQDLHNAQLESEVNKKLAELKDTISVLRQENLLAQNKLANLENEKKMAEDQLKNQYENKIQLALKELEIQTNVTKNELERQLIEKNNELEMLKIKRANVQTKILGEELEVWCDNEFQNYKLMGFANTTWEKANQSIKEEGETKGTKPDFLFRIFSDNTLKHQLSSVCLEMKTQAKISNGKIKNSEHYKKLDDDRKKQECQYALLVTELEYDTANDVPIRKIEGYEDMYQVRPAYFITFLSMIYALTQKFSYMIDQLNEKNDEFKLSNEIINEFKAMKITYFEKPIQSMVNDVEEIKKQASLSINANNAIVRYCDGIISSKINNILTKIERFDIVKIAKKISKLEEK